MQLDGNLMPEKSRILYDGQSLSFQASDMQPVSRKMQTNEQTDRVQGHSSCKTVFASTPTSHRCVLRVDQPWGCKHQSACPIEVTWDPGAEGCPRAARVSAVNGVSAQGFPIPQTAFALLFVPAEFAPKRRLNGSFLTLSNHSTASPNVQDELHTFLNHCAGPVSPTLHPTAGQEQAFPFPNPPLLALYLHQ